IAYQVLGDGPFDVVFVMGWISHMDYFWQQPGFARFLRRLASFSRVILFDKRGTGLSDRSVGLPSLDERMDDVRAVLDAVGSERAALLAISDAGALALTFAATHPRRTTALALVGCFPRRLWAPDYPWGTTLAARQRLLDGIQRGWGTLEWASSDLETRAPSVAHDRQFVEWWSTYLRMSASPGAAMAFTQMNNQMDVRPILPTIHVPTLVIHRSGDKQVDIATGRFLAERIPGAMYRELLGDDHLPFVGDQDEILDPIEEFFVGARSAGESDRVLATVLSLDFLDSGLAGPMEDVVRQQLERHRGRAVSSTGSALLATFDGPARGIRCARAIVDGSRSLGIQPRGALHTGECDLVGGALDGVPFQVATLATSHAPPGEVLVSGTVRDLVAGSGISFEDSGQQVTADGLGQWPLFRVADR
ncbi:MAG TPA: alpha/beta fold hydrolase, partial [Chloroflexota bacterium]|nr:alpha/beta fold hydrolase [Chloroflexota bacterium]